jgi:hypothetical protein
MHTFSVLAATSLQLMTNERCRWRPGAVEQLYRVLTKRRHKGAAAGGAFAVSDDRAGAMVSSFRL